LDHVLWVLLCVVGIMVGPSCDAMLCRCSVDTVWHGHQVIVVALLTYIVDVAIVLLLLLLWCVVWLIMLLFV